MTFRDWFNRLFSWHNSSSEGELASSASQLNASNSVTVSKAIVIWTAWGCESWPVRDDARLVKAFGDKCGRDLVSVVHALSDDFYSSGAWQFARNLGDAGDAAAAQFRMRHPDLSEDAIQALRWCYTFDYK